MDVRWGQVLEFLILDSNPQIHGELATTACPVLLVLVCENMRLRTRQDGEGDKEIVYTKEVVDRELRRVRGPDVLPFDERYAEERLYFRDSRKEWRDACQKDGPPA